MLTVLAEIHGNMEAAVRQASDLLNIQGRVLPVTGDDTRLIAELVDGTIIWGDQWTMGRGLASYPADG